MSDGPHKSLPMRRAWKKLAERADNCAFEPDQVAALLPEAIESDWRDEVEGLLPAVMDILQIKGQAQLFTDRNQQIEQLKDLAAGHPLAEHFVDNLEACIERGISPDKLLLDAATNTVESRFMRCARQIEEIYLRKTKAPRALRVRTRLNEAGNRVSWSGLASRLLTARAQRSVVPRSTKQSGLDDGVRIP